VSLRVRLAGTFALVAMLTWLAVALAVPTIVGRGFASLQGDWVSPGGGGPGSGQGAGASPGSGLHAQQIQQETTTSIIAIALLAAAGATILGFIIAGRIAAPLRRLERAAQAVAAGDLEHRSGLAARRDEIGALGRSFDEMAADLAAAEESRRRFFQDAAHELRTPLAVIEATSTAVLDGVYEHDERHLRTILEQSQLLSRIVGDLRTISLAETGNLQLRPARIDVSELVVGVVRSWAARAEAAGLALTSEAPAQLELTADRDRLTQVLGALVDNAIRHTATGGIHLSAAVQGGSRIRIEVADTGPGIPPDAVEHVFDRFYQADEARDRSSGTSGLGLAIVKALVEAQGGSVAAANGPAGGARFTIELPAG
jgi:two-component system, OmpR family, sensor histidine kinase BaeS